MSATKLLLRQPALIRLDVGSIRYSGICSLHRHVLSTRNTYSTYSTRSTCRHFRLFLCRPSVTNFNSKFNHSEYSSTPAEGNGMDPVFVRATQFKDRLALIDQHGKHTYSDLLKRSAKLAERIRSHSGVSSSEVASYDNRIAFLCDNDVSYLVTKWAIWMSGAIAVPLCKSHPANQMQYFIEDSQSSLVISLPQYQSMLQPVANEVGTDFEVVTQEEFTGSTAIHGNEKPRDEEMNSRPEVTDYESKPALIVYTSGTTGKPKGVVLTHGNLNAMITGMIEAWAWSADDVILHALPLHHVHGIVNVLMTPLHCGATCVMLPKFTAKEVWNTLLSPVDEKTGMSINLFMAVPTMYALLAEEFQKTPDFKSPEQRSHVRNTCLDKIRLMVSGSAALPQPIMEAWREITGHTLLERYGMSEIGMCLTNPLHGDRVPGAVGNPFPKVNVCIARNNDAAKYGYDVIAEGDCNHTVVTSGLENESGELMVKGPNVFNEYWNKPSETKATFTEDGWFKTGDTAVFQNGVYKIVGRTSVDVIKSGAYKISALEIERHLLAHPDIRDVAVVGLPDVTWGQKVAAIIVLNVGCSSLTQSDLAEWCADKMPPYHVPRVVNLLDTMPRNVMGKVNKKELVSTVFPGQQK